MNNILITGAGSGLGAELARIYSSKSTRIILIGRTLSKLQTVVQELEQKGNEAVTYVCDISDYESVENVSKIIRKEYKTIDTLINCAGIGHFGPFPDLGLQEIDQMININLKGTIFMTQAFINAISNRVINIISTAGLKGKLNESVYVASKFAVRGLTESLQKEYEESELTFTAVYMGGMDTPFWSNSNHIKDKNRLKTPKEVAELIKSMDDGRNEILI